jgi:Bardet-Biedl syndrome 9 protein
MNTQVSGVQSTPVIAYLTLFANRSFLAAGLDLAISGTYTGAQGEPRVIHQALRVPLALACRVRPAVKSAIHKLTLETPNASEAQSLLELFSDFLYAQQSIGIDPDEVLGQTGAMALGFEFWGGEGSLGFNPSSSQPVVVSVIASKTGGRYRVQSDSFAAMSLIVRELEVRLQAKLTGGAAASNAPRQVNLAEPLVLEAFFDELRAHFSVRNEISDRLSRLNDVSHQFRMIEKRLLVRFRDRNPSPLGGLDSMLRESYAEIIKLADEIQLLQSTLRRQRESLDASISLVSTLAAIKYSLDADNAALLRYHLAAEYQENSDQGWEDTVEASVTYLLKTSLAKNAKDAVAMNPQIEAVEDVDKVIKHIMMVFDRLGRGASLASKA